MYILLRLLFTSIASYVASALSASTSSTTIHTLIIPALGYAFDAVVAVLGILGFLLVRSGRFSLPANGPAKLNLATMAFIVGAGAIVLRTLLVIAAALTAAFSVTDLRVIIAALDLIMTVALGLFLFWVLDAAALLGPQVVGIIALVLTAVGSAIVGFARYVPRRAGGLDVTSSAGLLLFVIGLFLWLAAYTWGYGTVRSQRPGRGAAAPSGEGTDR